jgi:hypothetical protein
MAPITASTALHTVEIKLSLGNMAIPHDSSAFRGPITEMAILSKKSRGNWRMVAACIGIDGDNERADSDEGIDLADFGRALIIKTCPASIE